jgi:hypothetical protein
MSSWLSVSCEAGSGFLLVRDSPVLSRNISFLVMLINTLKVSVSSLQAPLSPRVSSEVCSVSVTPKDQKRSIS